MNDDLVLTILIVNYLKEYSMLEKDFRELFKENINLVEKNKESLYFLYGAHELSKTFQFDFVGKTITMSKVKCEKELGKLNCNLKNIINIIEEYDVIKDFPKSIDSVQSKVSYQIKDVLSKLGLVRNVLAHETGFISLENSTKYQVESLSTDNLKKYIFDLLEDSQIENLDGNEKIIAENLIYIRKLDEIINELK